MIRWQLGFVLFVVLGFFLSSCVILHHVQVSDIDDRQQGTPIEVILSETGVNLKEAESIARHFKGGEKTGEALKIIQFFQMGPTTGNPIYTEGYADHVREILLEKCPSGKIINLVSIREMNRYPVVSGEIIKITGNCLL